MPNLQRTFRGGRVMVAYMTEQEAAAYLTGLGIKFSPRTLQKQRVTGGGIPFVKLANRVRYRKSDVDNWLDSLPVKLSTSVG